MQLEHGGLAIWQVRSIRQTEFAANVGYSGQFVAAAMLTQLGEFTT
jgi:hypothetical protein